MELNIWELEVISQAVRNEREKAEKEYMQAINTGLDKLKYNRNEQVIYGVSDSLTTLQRFNNLMIKLEDELRKRHNSVF